MKGWVAYDIPSVLQPYPTMLTDMAGEWKGKVTTEKKKTGNGYNDGIKMRLNRLCRISPDTY